MDVAYKIVPYDFVNEGSNPEFPTDLMSQMRFNKPHLCHMAGGLGFEPRLAESESRKSPYLSPSIH